MIFDISYFTWLIVTTLVTMIIYTAILTEGLIREEGELVSISRLISDDPSLAVLMWAFHMLSLLCYFGFLFEVNYISKSSKQLYVHFGICFTYLGTLLGVIFVTVDNNYTVHNVFTIITFTLAVLSVPFMNRIDWNLIALECVVFAVAMITAFTFWFIPDNGISEYVFLFTFIIDKCLKSLIIVNDDRNNYITPSEP